MTSLYEDLKEGLEEILEIERSNLKARKSMYSIVPVQDFSNSEIRDIRIKLQMCQKVFAECMGVSNKTVEAWEKGTIHPSGPARRLLQMFSEGKINDLDFIKRMK